MKSCEILKQQLQRLDGKDYAAYQSLKGGWSYPHFELHLDRIPKDPYAPPNTGVYRARIDREKAGFPVDLTSTKVREIALRDFLARRFHSQCELINKGIRGTGNSGVISIAKPGQEILERTSIIVNDEFVEARFSMGLPAEGRSINSKTAGRMLFEEVPQIVESSLYCKTLDIEILKQHIDTAEDAGFLRDNLRSTRLVAFIADGALLPRRSGVDAKPLDRSNVVRFQSPANLRVRFTLPNAGVISGMGITSGVTLIVGGGYHGKSTLLQAVELGIYNHIPGDGREYCVSLPETVKVRAASGRSVTNTDISAFINNIPFREPTASFSTTNASGSTSQAAFIAEAMEIGAEVIVMDEDTCATNFMIRDKRMQELVAKEYEPITPYVDKVKQLHKDHGISTILVMGGSGDYLSVADCVIQMTEFKPYDVTVEAREIAKRFTSERAQEGGNTFACPRPRFPVGDGLDPRNKYAHHRVAAPDPQRLLFGRTTVDLVDIEQLVETGQTKAIGRAILIAKQYMDGANNLKQIAGKISEEINRGGLDVLDANLTGDLAQFRSLEFAAALNRMRGLKVKQVEQQE